MNPVMNGGINSRLLAVFSWLKSLGFNENDIHLFCVKSFVATSAGANGYHVPLCAKFNEIPTDKTQSQIGQSDAFAPVGLLQVVRKVTSAAFGIAPTMTYPSKFIFDLANENDQVAGLWRSGKVTLEIESSPVIHELPADILSYGPNTLELAASSASTGSRNDFEAFTPIFKDIIISGSTDAKVKLATSNYTSTAAIVGDTNEQNYVGYYVIGFEIRGGAGRANELAEAQGNKCVVR